MANWQASTTQASTARARPKTKDELRRMLTEAVCNTQPRPADKAKQMAETREIAARRAPSASDVA
jgi:hypothetical protein